MNGVNFLIGVVPKAHQVAVVDEFFELFKTPWEFSRPDRSYDVVIATADEIPDVNPKLLLVCGPTKKEIDTRFGFVARERSQRAVLKERGSLVPIYGELLTFADGGNRTCCVAASSGIACLRVATLDSALIRLGYDLFDEVEFLLSVGQPVEYAHIPTLEIHIRMLREWILQAGVPFIEILPVPAKHSFVACLTHDIDFVGIRNHRCDHSMWGFIYRATIGTLQRCLRGRLSLMNVLRSWLAVASLPLVYAGWAKDFWEPFEWYLAVENGLPATYFLIPFKGQPGENVAGNQGSRRAASYDLRDHSQEIAVLRKQGCELGVHGIDAWHSADKGRQEAAAITAITGESSLGVRIHWLLRGANTPLVLEQAGFAYDSTSGYNETIGYRAGTSQVFCPLGNSKLLELPLHIQDGALFYSRKLNLSEPEAEKRCQVLIENAGNFGGVLTVLWHDRSHGPERFWGDFYVRLVQRLRSLDCWFGTAGQVVTWFRKRREVRFPSAEAPDNSTVRFHYEGERIDPPLRIRVHTPTHACDRGESVNALASEFIDISWNGNSVEELERQVASRTFGAFHFIAQRSLA